MTLTAERPAPSIYAHYYYCYSYYIRKEPMKHIMRVSALFIQANEWAEPCADSNGRRLPTGRSSCRGRAGPCGPSGSCSAPQPRRGG